MKELQMRRIDELFCKSELMYCNLVSYHEAHEFSYEEMYASDYDQDMKNIIDNYNKIIESAIWILKENTASYEKARKAKLLAAYRLGVLYTVSGKYDKAVGTLYDDDKNGMLEQALLEIELASLDDMDEFRYEHIDIYLKRGKCYIEKRADKELIEECYQRAELILAEVKDRQSCKAAEFLKEPLKSYGRNMAFKSYEDLEKDLNLAWAIYYIDIYDRLCLEDGDHIKEQKKLLGRLEARLKEFEKMPKPVTEKVPSDYVEVRSIDGNGLLKYALRRCEQEAQPEDKLADTYLSTRGLYHLKQYQFEEKQVKKQFEEQLILALECFTAAFLCNHRNTIAMDNIALICCKGSRAIMTGRKYGEFRDNLQKLDKCVENSEKVDQVQRELCRIHAVITGKVKEAVQSASDKGEISKSGLLELNRPYFLAIIRNKILIELNRPDFIKTVYESLETPSEQTGAKLESCIKRALERALDEKGGQMPDCLKGESLEPVYGHILSELANKESAESFGQSERPKEKTEDKYVLLRKLCKISAGENEEQEDKEWNNSIEDFLKEVLKIEPCNMYALNLLVMLEEYELKGIDAADDIFTVYMALRQSTLKKRLKNLDNMLWDRRERGHELITDSIDLKKDLIKFYKCISEFINTTIVELKEDRPLIVGHYTKMKTLPKLIDEKNSACLHLSNKAYLNDPREGQIMLTMLEDEWKAKNAETDKQSLMQLIFEEYNSESLKRNYVYVGCFSSNIDALPMWDRYADGGRGVCFITDAERTFDKKQEVDLRYVYTEDNEENLSSLDGKYALHKVIYYPDTKSGGINSRLKIQAYNKERWDKALDKTKDADSLEVLCELTYEILQLLEDEFERVRQQRNMEGDSEYRSLRAEYNEAAIFINRKLDDLKDNASEQNKRELKNKIHKLIWEKETSVVDRVDKKDSLTSVIENAINKIKTIDASLTRLQDKLKIEENQAELKKTVINIVMLILDQARFLVKSAHFRDEQEYRIIKYSSAPKADSSQGEIPGVYIDMRKPIKYKEIVIGPKAAAPESVGAYVLNMRKSQEDGSINENTVVRKSSIPFH